MKKVTIGKSNIEVSELTLGCMSLSTNEKNAQSIIDAALNAGITHLDTADLYDFGMNESLLGKIIKNKRKDLVLTSKVGNHFDPTMETWFWDPSPSYINKAIDDSLTRLQTDYLDFYLLHGGTIEDPIDDIIDTFERLKEKGKIRAYGISSIRPNVIRQYVEKSNIDLVMMQYNMLDRRPEELLPYLENHQISVVARGPFAKGLLTDDYKKHIDQKLKESYITYSAQEVKTILQALQSTNKSLNELALQYILHQPTVKTAVFGASSLEQIQKNIAAYHTDKIDEELYTYIQSVTKAIQYENHR